MAERNVDVAIIGAGTAGMRAYREASKLTNSILLIEGDQYGTTCARVGCMPSKLLIAAAEAAHHGERVRPMGVHYEPAKINGAEIMGRIKSERDRFVGFVKEAVEEWPAEHRVMAHAAFKDDHTLQLSNGDVVKAARIVIATGSRPKVFPVFESAGDRLIVNDDVFDWADLPGSVAVFGGGVIGLELGQALHRLGVRVALFGKDCLVGPLTDNEVRKCALQIFTDEMDYYPDADFSRIEKVGDAVEIDHKVDGAETTSRFDYVLVATGRQPNVDKLGLENTSLKLDDRGVPVFNPLNTTTSVDHIFIAGDADNKLPLLHVAADDGYVAGYNAGRFPDIRSFAKVSPLSVVFSDPQIMMCGETYRDLTDRDADFETGSIDWSDQGRARVMLVNKGLLRVYGEKGTGLFLGAEMVGPAAEHIAHLLGWAHQSKLTVHEILERPFYHPVMEEGVRTALRNLNYALQMGPPPPPRCIDCGPGG
ncbi:MAG: dihydrolipoyl dehydrogenase [Pseudomonadota bacterium]